MNQKTDLRIVKTYAALHNAFTELLSKKPFEDITTNELCDAAMIRRTTFYKHFADKFDYFSFYLSELIQDSKAAVPLETFEENILEYTEQRLHEHLKFMRQNKNLVYHCKNSNLVAFFLQTIQREIEKEMRYLLIDIKKYPPSPQLDFAIAIRAGGMISAMGWWLEHPDTLSDHELAKLLAESFTYPELF